MYSLFRVLFTVKWVTTSRFFISTYNYTTENCQKKDNKSISNNQLTMTVSKAAHKERKEKGLGNS